ncbi:Cro/CI family transcriptional regulator [Endozoicomonas montiporae]|uniref:Uncharacterized protein n=1 Tax=Endozoicomonas montiporae CL-33 TaxID=570277 RepID=A0A142BHB5_9GAMM|nr:hypothetical protein EZMO1_4218 [Endozoicomonas montiporae CL-33]
MNTYKKLLAYFRTQERIAVALGVRQPSISQWKGVIPVKHAKTIERLTNGDIAAIDVVSDYDLHNNK